MYLIPGTEVNLFLESKIVVDLEEYVVYISSPFSVDLMYGCLEPTG